LRRTLRVVRALPVVILLLLVAPPPLSAAATPTNLVFIAVSPSEGRAVFHLKCGPPGGDLPDPVQACAALAATPDLVTNPTPFNCLGGSAWEITITGQLKGQPIRRRFLTCWTSQMATLGYFGMSGALWEHLLPRRHKTLLAGTKRVFAPGVLRPADLVTCDILGHHLAVGVPTDTGPGGGSGYRGVFLTVAYQSDGSVSASCLFGPQ
jgi:hypothetical protein